MTKIISAPAAVLSQTARPFDFEKDNISLLLANMQNALLSAEDPKGVGLAAPQIAEGIKVFITKPTDKSKIQVFINPQILDDQTKNVSSQKLVVRSRKAKRVRKLEGCLSLPAIWGEVLRAPTVTLSYQTENGKTRTKKFTGFMATIIQHEVDHLNGILFPKRVLEQHGQLYKSTKNEKGEDEFEELNI